VGAPESSDADDDLRFAAAIAGFGQLLRDPRYLGTWSWGDAIRLAEQARGADRFGYRAEAILLMRLAQSLSLP
jgi:Ca-activated chloride channel family protein